MDADFSHKKNVFVSLLNCFIYLRPKTFTITLISITAKPEITLNHSNNIKIILIRRHQLVEGGWLRKTPFPLKA